MADNKTSSLTVLGGPLAGTLCELPENGTLTIGSSPDSSLYLDLLAVSPFHARVVAEGGRVTVHDTGSSRTVHVNDNAIGPEGMELRNGDILWLGSPGDDEVVMLQCILPRRLPAPALTPPGALSSGATPTPHIETVALWATETATDSPAAAESEAESEAETEADEPAMIPDAVADAVAEAAAAIEEPMPMAFEDDAVVGEASAATEEATEDEPELVTAAIPPEPVAFAEEPSPEVEEPAAVVEEPAAVVEEAAAEVVAPAADAYVVEEGEIAEVAPTLLMSSPDEVAEAVEPVEPGYRETVALEAPAEFTPEMFEPPEVPALEATPADEPFTVETTPEFEPPALEATPEPPPPPPPPPPVSAAPPVPPRAPAPAEPRPAAVARPAAWQATRPQSPSASQRVHPSASQRPKARPAPARPAEPAHDADAVADAPQEEAAGSRRPLLLAVGGFVAVVVLAGGGFLAWRTLGSRPAAPVATPTPVAEVSEPVQPPIAATPAPDTTLAPDTVAPTPEPIAAATPTPEPVRSGPAPAATPTPRPTPTPRATPSPATAAATPTPSPAGPSPEQLRAQQTAALVGQAEAAIAARQYDAALSHLDGALRLEPGNARATSLRSEVVQRRDLARRRFVAGRTAVDSEKTRKEKERGGLVGFDTDAKTPDFLGRIEFEMTPASGVQPNDAWTLKVFVVNQGAKPIRVAGLTVTTTANGSGGGGPVTPAAREVAPQQRVLLGETSGTWADGTTAWVAEATLTAPKNETLKNTLSWK